MDLNRIATGSMKGQLMTILVLVIFMLMLASILAFAISGVTSYTLSQSTSSSSISSGYGQALSTSASTFAKASLKRALNTLFIYEYNASLRKANFISNFSLYMGSLIRNGTLPNVVPGSATANSLAKYMGNLTFASYNTLVGNATNIPYQQFTINQTNLAFGQSSAYTLSVSYTEQVSINVSGNRYQFNVPVNATIQLNNTPDLWFAQQGVYQPIRFATLANLTYPLGKPSSQAIGGNAIGYVYGDIIYPSLISNSSCNLGLPGWLTGSADQYFILVASNGIGYANCFSSYGGLITSKLSGTPKTSYLAYPANSPILTHLVNGEQVLLFGPTFASYNVQGLINAVSSGSFFASPFTPSFMQRAQSTITQRSPAGMFTFNYYNTQAAQFNGASSLIDILDSTSLDGITSSVVTVSAWVETTSSNTEVVFSSWDGTNGYQLLVGNSLGEAGVGTSGSAHYSSKVVNNGAWHNIVGVWTGSSAYVYVDGNMVLGPISATFSASTKDNQIGAQCSGAGGTTCSDWLSGLIADVQVFNAMLSPSQIQYMYQEGVDGVPPSGSGLVGWWPLNGNANDISGQSNNGNTVTNVAFVGIPGYQRDSIFMYSNVTSPVGSGLSALPGIGGCVTMSTCANTLSHNIYLGQVPLELGQQYSDVAYFNGSAYIKVSGNTLPVNSQARSVSAWVYLTAYPTNSVLSTCAYTPCYTIAGWGNSGTAGQSSDFLISNAGHPYFDGYSDYYESNSVVPTNQWTFLAFNYSPGTNTVTVCMNTVCQTGALSSGAVLATASNPLYIGAWATGLGDYMQGYIANLQVYNSSLTTAQKKALYNEGVFGAPVTTNGLVGWYPLDGSPNENTGFGSLDSIQSSSVAFVPLSGASAQVGIQPTSSTMNEWQVIGLAYPYCNPSINTCG